jgi:hypothetical protein
LSFDTHSLKNYSTVVYSFEAERRDYRDTFNFPARIYRLVTSLNRDLRFSQVVKFQVEIFGVVTPCNVVVRVPKVQSSMLPPSSGRRRKQYGSLEF